jgi:hypothetical protein
MYSRQVEPIATDSSQDELDLDGEEEDDELSIIPKKTSVTSGQPLKRKDGGWDIGTASKRLKLKAPDISDGVGSISAPGALGDGVLDLPSAEEIIAVPPTTSNTSSSVAGPSRTSTSISARASTSSSMAPPADTPRRNFGKSTLDFTRLKASRLLTSEQKAAASSSSRPSTSEAGSSSQRVKPSNHPLSSVSSKKPPAPPAKTKPSENEIIEISSDSDSDSPPPPKRDIKPKTARKFTGGQQPRRSSPPKRKNDPDPEIIEILDSDDEMAKPQVTTGKSVVSANGTRNTAKVLENASTSKPPAEDAMDIDHSDAPVEVNAPRKGMDIDHPMDREPNISAALRWTPSPPLKPKPEPATPAQPSLPPQPGSSSIKKPNRQGFNPISIPGDITLPPSPTKRRLQTAVKTASGSFKQREISASQSSASSPAGNSESGEESSNPNSRGSTSDPGPDLRNLTDALGINSTGHSSPEPQVPTKKLPTPPKATNQPVSITPQLMFHRISHPVAIGTLQS